MLELAIDSRKALIAPGMEVRRILPFRLKRMVGPFIFMDHAGPVGPRTGVDQSLDVLPHPHIGLSTVSYLFNGAVTHRDSLGVEQVIEPGEVNWMTAGKGIAHSERFEDPRVLAAGGFEMIQTWVALPERDEESDPSFVNYKKSQLQVYTDKGIWMRLVAGTAFGLTGNVKTHSPLFYLHAAIDKDARFAMPSDHEERAVYIVKGQLDFLGRSYQSGQMILFRKNTQPVVTAVQAATVMLLGGAPLGERFIWWNFVSSRADRIEQAKADWKAGRIVLPPTDQHEFIPLPDDKSRPSPQPPALS